ncbi:hypothetical protein LPTSP3_g29800 [Leptospira kobayashii]|uniref:Uncharacterized protein n=1 Tax=Leptospira kobayashii TaxID=1917830 RepID=A0ABN6KH84_9LEPT|nr:hypothetical protein LPTSP3_g29800 [Leptospira kobayashii]
MEDGDFSWFPPSGLRNPKGINIIGIRRNLNFMRKPLLGVYDKDNACVYPPDTNSRK